MKYRGQTHEGQENLKNERYSRQPHTKDASNFDVKKNMKWTTKGGTARAGGKPRLVEPGGGIIKTQICGKNSESKVRLKRNQTKEVGTRDQIHQGKGDRCEWSLEQNKAGWEGVK